MNKRIPKRLKKEPLIESIWEIRFSSAVDPVAELLPGLIFKAFGSEFQVIERLPAASIPAQLRQADVNWHYVPTVRLNGPPYAIQVGEHVVSLSCGRPYSGWAKFGEKIRMLAEVLKETNLISAPERFSMKYLDVLPMDGTPTISMLNVVMSLGERHVASDPVYFRTERTEGNLLHILQIICPAKAQLLGGAEVEGVLVDTDTVYKKEGTTDFWQNLEDRLNAVHDANKKMFFDLLKEETIASLEPEY